jgi:7,8-dihydropterin-6-yl-methyl-4-(beta-D-ribofuranosyl)aminobenzene 5'-phosphate synthase
VKLTIIYDNEIWQPGLKAAWGFSCLVEANGQRLLFDTGGDGEILLKNMATLKLDLQSFSEIFISHEHWDHLGGLADLLRLKPDVRVYLPSSCFGLSEVREVIRVQTPLEISGIFCSTGELPGVEIQSLSEQSLVVKTEKGLAVIVGCSHPGVGTILKAASRFGPVAALIGGLHGFQEYEVLEDLALICPCHCTKQQAEILKRYPETAISGGAGRVLEFG